MIRLLQGTEITQHPELMEQIFTLRAKVFHERMGWEVSVKNGQETDFFDTLNPLYIISTNRKGQINGTMRLLPTTGPNMLSNVFTSLLPKGENVNSPLIWECSRFAIDHQAFSDRSGTCINTTTIDMLLALNEVGMTVGLEFIMAVVDVRMERVLRMAGSPCDRLGEPVQVGKVKAIAGLWEVGEEWQQSLLKAGKSSQNRILSSAEIAKLSIAA